MRIRWTAAAAEDLQQIGDYLLRNYPRFRQSTLKRNYSGIASLRSSPYRGRQGEILGTRELVFSPLPYAAVYRVGAATIEILRIRHTSKRSM
ncbi:MAG: type II toxin-antitoxin system RelE/ParE family toxin [Acidobacteria bacterium]|nr:type II toxin-antitoxin system RelE/ParE family toxin [Acidobacteriota bacterium]